MAPMPTSPTTQRAARPSFLQDGAAAGRRVVGGVDGPSARPAKSSTAAAGGAGRAVAAFLPAARTGIAPAARPSTRIIVPQRLQRTDLWTQSDGMRRLAWQPGHFA